MSSAPDTAAQRRGIQVGVVAYTLWGLLTIYWKQLSAFDAVELIGWRMLCAAVVMVLVTTLRGTWPNLVAVARDWRTAAKLVFAATVLSVNWGSYVWAVHDDRVIETALGYFIAPLATMAIGVLVLNETPTTAQRVAFVLAAVAVVIVGMSAGRPPWIALLIAATWSLYALAKRNAGLDALDSLAGETFALALPAAVVILVLSSRSTSVVSTASSLEWVLVAGTGVITVVPLALFASAAQSIPFTLLGPLNLIVPVIGFILGWVVYSEPVPALRMAGFALVWCALIAIFIDRFLTSSRSKASDQEQQVR